jgi:hypothetical protein
MSYTNCSIASTVLGGAFLQRRSGNTKDCKKYRASKDLHDDKPADTQGGLEPQEMVEEDIDGMEANGEGSKGEHHEERGGHGGERSTSKGRDSEGKGEGFGACFDRRGGDILPILDSVCWNSRTLQACGKRMAMEEICL